MKFAFKNCEVKGMKINNVFYSVYLRFAVGSVALLDWMVKDDFRGRGQYGRKEWYINTFGELIKCQTFVPN